MLNNFYFFNSIFVTNENISLFTKVFLHIFPQRWFSALFIGVEVRGKRSHLWKGNVHMIAHGSTQYNRQGFTYI